MPKPRVIISSSYRGRIGKTFWGGHFVDYLKRCHPSVKLKAFDPDLVNASLLAFYPEAEPVDISKPIELDRMLAALGKNDVVFIDGLGGHYQSVADWIVDVNLFHLAKEMGFSLTFVVLITDNTDTIRHADALLKATPKEVDFLIVKNTQFSPNNIWASTKVQKAFHERGAIEFTLPRNHAHIELIFDEAKQPAFSLSARKGIQLGDQQRLLNLGRLLDKEFDRSLKVLVSDAPKVEAAQ